MFMHVAKLLKYRACEPQFFLEIITFLKSKIAYLLPIRLNTAYAFTADLSIVLNWREVKKKIFSSKSLLCLNLELIIAEIKRHWYISVLQYWYDYIWTVIYHVSFLKSRLSTMPTWITMDNYLWQNLSMLWAKHRNLQSMFNIAYNTIQVTYM